MSSTTGLFHLLWPPLPSRIAAKLAFLPPEPTYSVVNQESGWKFKMNDDYEALWEFSGAELPPIEVSMEETRKGNRIPCMYIRCAPHSPVTVLFSHGNAVDLGLTAEFCANLGYALDVNFFSYDYSGYGVSTGKPLEENMYADMECAWGVLRNKYKVQPENIVLYGQSLGTVPTVDLASRNGRFYGVVLHSPLTSGVRLAFPNTRRTHWFDVFPNIDKVPRIKSPCLVMHGKQDEVIPFSHGQQTYEGLPNPVEPLWIDEGGHNDLTLYPEFLERLKKFFSEDLPRENASGVRSEDENTTNDTHTSWCLSLFS